MAHRNVNAMLLTAKDVILRSFVQGKVWQLLAPIFARLGLGISL